MKKTNYKFGARGLIFSLAVIAGFIVFLSVNRQQAHSKGNLEVTNSAPDEEYDEALSSSCGGVERWAVKVMTDASWKNFDSIPKFSSVTHLVGLTTPSPSSSMPRYDAVEDSCYSVEVTITEMRVESDSDWHLVITDGTSNTMIAECPCPNCTSVAASHYIGDFTAARNWIAANIGNVTNTSLSINHVWVTGQAFIDPPHGQSGAAPNNLELHSIIRISFAKPTGITTFENTDAGVNVYPNPSTGLFHVNFTQTVKSNIRVFNMLGEQVYQGPLTEGNVTDINLTGMPRGMYLYDVIAASGDPITSGKLMIQ
jgi:hypothetical protein